MKPDKEVLGNPGIGGKQMTEKESCLRLKCKDIRQNPLHLD